MAGLKHTAITPAPLGLVESLVRPDHQLKVVALYDRAEGEFVTCKSAPTDDPLPKRFKWLIYKVESRGGWGHNRRRR